MKTIKKSPIIFGLLSLIAFFAFAKQEKVLQIFRNGEVIQEYAIDDIDYIEVNEIIPAPEDITAAMSNGEVIIKWDWVEGATYNIYRSPDNVNFTLLASNIIENCYTDTNPLDGSNFYRVKAVVGYTEGKYSQTASAIVQSIHMPSGIYLGINGFSKGLQTYPIELLSEDNTASYQSFVKNLSAIESFTWLYYTVDKSIDILREGQFPEDLTDLAIVTFTDGLDIGSLDEKEKEGNDIYMTNAEYRDALHSLLMTENVNGIKISAYTIGVIEGKGASITTFRNNMASLATSSDNVFEVDKIDNLNQIFQNLANSLSETKYVQRFTLSISGQSHNEECKFTFDDVSNHSDSKLYIEGTYNRQLKALSDISYTGLTSNSGSVVAGIYNEEDGKYDFVFDGLQSNDGTLIPTDCVNHWFTDEGIWQDVDDEFYFSPDDASIQKIKKSAAIILNLDCSKSMSGNKIDKLKEACCLFIQKLSENSVDPSEVSSVSLNKTNLSLPQGSSEKLIATILPETAKLKSIKWTSSDNSIALVDNFGVVTAIAPGEAIITATTDDGGFTAQCKVLVICKVEEIVLSSSLIDMYTGDTMVLTADIYPKNATNKDIIFVSSNPAIANVDDDGNVKGLKQGESTIKAMAADGYGAYSICNINVLQHVEDVKLSYSSIEANVGATKQLYATISPTDANNKNVIWSSSDTNIATVSPKGHIKAISQGTAIISVTTEDGGIVDQCEITVRQPVAEIQINHTELDMIVGQEQQLSAEIFPYNADNQDVIWTSSNEMVATVSQKGIVTSLYPGSAVISVSAIDGSNKSATCVITVTQPMSSISLDMNELEIEYGQTKDINIIIEPVNASYSNLIISNSNPNIISITKNGNILNIKSIGVGSSTITVSTEDGVFNTSCNVKSEFSTTPTNLALAITKKTLSKISSTQPIKPGSGTAVTTRYYIPLELYTGTLPSGYSKDGVVVSNGTSTFILSLYDASNSTLTYTDANALGTLPSQIQAIAITSNWYSLDSAIIRYGGTSISGKTYWTQTVGTTARTAYTYSASGVSSLVQDRSYYARKVIP